MSPANMSPMKQKPRFSVAITTDGYRKLINNTLGDPNRAKRFVSGITSAVAVNPLLQDCDAGTILAGALLGESLGLSPSPQLGQYYLVPFDCKVKGPDGKPVYETDAQGNKLKDSRGRWIAVSEKKAQFVLGYKGYVQLALRSGSYKDLDAIEVKEGEYKGRDKQTGRPVFEFIEDDDVWDSLPTVGYMAYFEYLNGFRKTVYWSQQKMMKHADQFSPAFSATAFEKLQNGEIPNEELWKYSSFWYKDFSDMAKKTLLRHIISRWGIMSTEMLMAFDHDTTMLEMGRDNEFVSTPETQIELAQQNYDMVTPEAEQVVEKVDLSEI